MRYAINLKTKWGANAVFWLLASIVPGCNGSSPQSRAQTAPAPAPAPAPSPTPSSSNATPCVPSSSNNYCSSTPLSPADQCMAQILNPPALAACQAAGFIFNRVTQKCSTTIALKPNCTMQDVYAAFVAPPLNDPQSTIDAQVATLTANFTAALGTATTATLDQCGTFTENGTTFLVPIFIGKSYATDSSGVGTYQIQAGKICSSSYQHCQDPSLNFSNTSATPQTFPCKTN